MRNITICLIVICIRTFVVCEMFSATAQLAQLINTQKMVIENLDNFINKKEEIFESLQNFRNRFKAEYDEAQKNIENYVQNPINAYTIIKRLTVDVNDIAHKLDIFNLKNINVTMKYPSEEDLSGASESIARLQETYNLKTSDLAAGKIYDKLYSAPMTPSDCFEIGRTLYDKKHFYYSSLWLLETLNKFDGKDSTPAKSIIYEYLAFCNYEMNDLEKSLKWIEKMINEHPNQEDLKKRKSELQHEMIEKLKAGEEISYHDLEEKKEANIIKTEEDRIYQALCRGDYQLPANYTKGLTCFYDVEGHPYLRIAPFKVEVVFLDPYITVYHNILTETEIENVIKLATPKLVRGVAVDKDADGNDIESPRSYRVSQIGWLEDTEDSAVARISRRAGHMSHFTLKTAESLQANIYGIGGHYVPHYDMDTDGIKIEQDPEQGDRIATVLFYMSDVLLGGSTAFTELGISVKPQKGSAVIWRNLLPSCEADIRTRHAACPVILGSKWVCNKWLHERGQEFVAPCNLEYQRQNDAIVSVKPILTVSPK